MVNPVPRLVFCVAMAMLMVQSLAAGGGGADSADVDEKDVLVLTPENFESTISSNKNVLVEFYAPWCGHCKQLTPHYARAATALKQVHPEVVLGKVDADKHKDLGTKFGVKGFPTIKWFNDGTASEYNGGRTDDTIVSWIKKRLGPATKTLSSVKDHDDFVGAADVAVVGYFESPKAGNKGWDTFVTSALEAEGIEFGNAEAKDIHDHAGFKEGQIVLHKKSDGGQKIVFDGVVSAAEIKNWIGIHQLAYVTDFSPESSSKIFGSPVKSQVLLFAEKTGDEYETLRSELASAAKDHHGKTVAVYVSPDQKQVLDYFGVTQDTLPCVFAVKLPAEGQKGQMVRFKGPAGSELSVKGALSTFIGDVLAGKIAAHRKTEPVPAQVEDENGVTTLVGSNFEEIVFDENKDVLVEFYAPWCGHCKQLVPIYDKLGQAFKDIPSVVIAKMDATANDPPEGTDIQGFPTIKFFKAGKDKKGVDFEGDRTFKVFKKYIKKNAGIKFELKKKAKKEKGPAKSEL